MKQLSFLVIALGLAIGSAAQRNDQPNWKKQLTHDFMVSGLGISLSQPGLTDLHRVNDRWVSADLQWLFLNARFGQGSFDFNPLVSGQLHLLDDPWKTLHMSYAGFGINTPIPFLGVGKYNDYNRVLRLSGFVRANYGRYRMFVNGDGQPVRFAGFEVAPGARLRIPYGSIDLALSFNFTNLDENDPPARQLRGFNSGWVVPSLTFRYEGLFDGMDAGLRSSQGASTASSRSSKTERYTDATGRRMERETITYNTTVTPKTVSVTDIGTYGGIGVKVTHSGARTRQYQTPGTLIGVSGLMRGGVMSFGLNLEGGRVGHASALQEDGDDDYYRRADRSEDWGMGSISVFNAYLDFGLSINNLIYAGLGTVVLDDQSTPFSSINIGTSLGIYSVFNQELNDEAASAPLFDAIPADKRSHFNDPRMSKGGLLGGWFVSWDIGNVTFRAHWYRYRRAPLANGLMYSAVWRFGSSKR